MRVPPTDLDHGEVRDGRVHVDEWTSFGFDTALIVGGCDLMPRHGKRSLDSRRNEWCRHGLAGAREFAGGTITECTRPKLHQVRNRHTRCGRLRAISGRECNDSHGRQDRGGYERDAPREHDTCGAWMTCRHATRPKPAPHRRLALAWT